MNKSESITHLAAALAKAQGEMPVAVFDAANPFLKTKYASLGAVIQSSRPILAKHKLSLVQFPISFSALEQVFSPGQPSPGLRPPSPTPLGEGLRGVEYIGIESILTHESGEFVSEKILIPLTEEKGKSKVQSAGSTLTYLRRYSWASILGMYSDEDSDGAEPRPGNLSHGPLSKGSSATGLQAFQSKSAAHLAVGHLPPPPTQRK
jgi:hypothetical protein